MRCLRSERLPPGGQRAVSGCLVLNVIWMADHDQSGGDPFVLGL